MSESSHPSTKSGQVHSDLEWLVMTPVLLRQFRVFYAPDRPIGVALLGVCERRGRGAAEDGAGVAPADWKSGEKLWLVDIVAPFGGHDAMIKDLKEKVFPGRKVRYLAGRKLGSRHPAAAPDVEWMLGCGAAPRFGENTCNQRCFPRIPQGGASV